jgi:hypothetical protein
MNSEWLNARITYKISPQNLLEVKIMIRWL